MLILTRGGCVCSLAETPKKSCDSNVDSSYARCNSEECINCGQNTWAIQQSYYMRHEDGYGVSLYRPAAEFVRDSL